MTQLFITSAEEYYRQLEAIRGCSETFEAYLANPTHPKKQYIELRIGVHFPCFNKPLATKVALVSLRQFYPEVPVHLVSDAGMDFSEIAASFNCCYTHYTRNLGNFPCTDVVAWLKRLLTTCEKFVDVDWIVLMEDDVRVRDRISKHPNAHLAGQGGGFAIQNPFHDPAKAYIWEGFPGLEINYYSGCGGSIIHRESFIQCMKNIESYDVERFSRLDPRLGNACDASLSYLFLLNGMIVRRWFDFSEESCGRFGPAAAFDHQFKKYYV